MNEKILLNFKEKLNKIEKLNLKQYLIQINMKQCTGCKQILMRDQFYKDKKSKDGLGFRCKKCRKESDRAYNNIHSNKERKRKNSRKYYKENEEARRNYSKIYTRNNKEKINKYANDYRKSNKEAACKYGKEYYKKNRKRHIKNQVKYTRERMKNDPKLKTTVYMGAAIRDSLKTRNISKNYRHWESLVDFNLEELIIHLESLFQPGMTWKNRGKWHIDHIKPINLFKFKNVDDPGFKKCWSLNNLQPLWARDNMSKSNKYGE